MAWSTTLITNLKYYLDPTDLTTYTDAQLVKFTLLGAAEMFTKLGLTSYVVDYTAETITPDPESDTGLSALIVVNTAIIIIRGEIRKHAFTAGFKVSDDRSTVDGAEALKALKDLLKMYMDMLGKAVTDYQRGINPVYTAILSPYTRGA